MTKLKFIILLLIFFGCVFLANSSHALGKKKTPHPLDVYNHEMHNAIFEGTVKCEHCHIGDAYDRKTILENWRKKGMVGCHDCHNANTAKPIMPIPKDCKTCHKVWPKPASHDTNWQNLHQSVAKQNSKYCDQCHKQYFCINCHQRRDPIQTIMHDRNFRYIHSIEARANPRRCNECHALQYCLNCHASK